MGGMNGEESGGFLSESVEVRWGSPDERDALLAELDRPWVMTEGPLDAWLFRHQGTADELDERLLLRGTAFDTTTTVVWDEDAVQKVSKTDEEPNVLAMWQYVLVRERLQPPRGEGPQSLVRIDYLQNGALKASRWIQNVEEA